MSIADHANTVRDALAHCPKMLGPAEAEIALAALDALQAKAETAEHLQQAFWTLANETYPAVLAERDAAVQAAEELHEQLSSARERWAHYYEAHKAAEQAAEQAHAALRQIIDLMSSSDQPWEDPVAIARTALAGNQP